MHHCRGDGLTPSAESGDNEIVQTTDETAEEEGLGTLATAFSIDENLSRGCSLRERILAVHLLHEIFPERNEEEDAEHTAKKG